jgi:hypothetical protein
VKIFPLSTFLKRRKSARIARRLCSGLEANDEKLGKSSYYLEAIEKLIPDIRKMGRRLYKDCDKTLEKIRTGTLVNCEQLELRFKQFMAEINALNLEDADMHRFANMSTATMQKAQAHSAPLDSKLQSDLGHRANLLRDHIRKMRKTPYLDVVREERKRARLLINKVKRSVVRALKVMRSAEMVAHMPAHALTLGEPITQLWREYLENLEASRKRFVEAFTAANYDEAMRYLRESKDLMRKIRHECKVEQRRAVDGIDSWMTILQNATERREALQQLRTESEQPVFLSHWEQERSRLGVEASQHYAEALRKSQAWMKKDLKLKQAPIHTIELSASSSSPVLQWNELEDFALQVRRKMGKGGAITTKGTPPARLDPGQ